MVEGTTFSDLVREAFIDPLRSVLIVDDQYPTWEEILNSAMDDVTQKQWRNEPNGPLGVIKQFRNRKPGFVIDIHDGLVPSADGSTLEATETPMELADHLHQSDLLVLDYNLEGESSGLGGEKARAILQSVLSNKHFNLIIVHTGEGDLEGVLFDCLLSSMKNCSSQFGQHLLEGLEQLDQKLKESVDEGGFDKKQLSQYFGINEYIEYRRPDIEEANLVDQYMQSKGILAPLGEWAKTLGLSGGERRSFLYWAIREFEKTKASMFADKPHEGLRWHSSEHCKWLRTVRGFVTFVGKGSEDLLKELQKALENWQPTPSRLLSAKYRHELNRIGVEAEDRTLSKSHVFAQFYSDICNFDSEDSASEAEGRLRAAKLKDHVSRQSEAISFHIEDEIVRFGEKVVEADRTNGKGFSSYYGIDLTKEDVMRTAVAHYNSYVSTLPLKQKNDQLDSGHILKINGEWWVCATPACDLQPKQTTIAFIGHDDDLRPFTALRLYEDDVQGLSERQINSGEYCFVETEPRKIIALGLRILTKAAHEKPETATNTKVTWRMFLAKNNGQINDHKLGVLQLKLHADGINNAEAVAQVVAKLRYEYALNYIQKVGASVSRIGLGYMSTGEDDHH